MSKAAQRKMQKRRDREQELLQQNAVAAPQKRWMRAPQQASLSRGPLAGKVVAQGLALLEHLDGMAPLRNGLRRVAEEKREWAGIPMPLEGERLVVEPTYPKAKELMAIGRTEPANDDGDFAGARLVNEFYHLPKRCTVHIYEIDGKFTFGITPGMHHFKFDLTTLGCSDAWGIEQESNAVHTLGSLVSHRQFKQYMLTGMFIESSKRSGVSYVFRRLRPTVALSTSDPANVKILCALCLHPIAYYQGSWAGAMTPTDDVIAHLSMMRGDEAMFWRRANQHPSYRPEAGL